MYYRQKVPKIISVSNNFKKAAESMLIKNEKIDIMLAKQDMNNLKTKVFEEGMHY